MVGAVAALLFATAPKFYYTTAQGILSSIF